MANIVVEATGAAIVTGASGVSATAPVDALGPEGEKIEAVRINLLTYSNDFTNAAWAKVTMTTAMTSTGPDGVANSATRLTASGALSTILQLLVAAASDRTWSVWMRRITGTGTIKLFQGATKTADKASLLNGTTYTRIEQDATVDVTLLGVGIEIGTSTDAVDVWCGQFEAGAFASSPITTTTVAVQRNASVAQYVSAGNILNTATSLTMSLTPESALGSTLVYHWASYVDASNYTAIYSDGTDLRVTKYIAGADYYSSIPWTRTVGTAVKIGARWDGVDGVDVWLNGTKGTTNATLTDSQMGAAFQVGANGNGGLQDFCDHRFLNIYTRSLPDGIMAALTT